MELCRRTGAEPLIVINIGHRDSRNLERAAYIQEALDWMEYCNGPASSQWGKVRAANGHPQPYNVKYWEISNETWSMGPDAYVQAVRDFVPPMRQKYPAIKIAVCGGSGTAAGNQRNWDETLLKGDVAKLYDYLSIHHYENADRFNEGVQDFDKHFAYLADLIRASENPKIKLDVSEWNVREGSDWRAGLYAGGLLNVFERRSDVVEIGGPALFMRHQSARNWDNAFINFDQTGWFPAPNYVVMKLWHDNFAPNLLAATGDAKSLNFTATKSEKGDKVNLKAVNPVGEAATVNVELTGGAKPTRAAMQLVAPGSVGARNSLAQPSVVAPKQGQATIRGNVVSFALPPLSVGVVVIDVAPTR
jgi:alpha-N-arabinofuranosidase